MIFTAKACADPASRNVVPIQFKPGVLRKVYILIPPGHQALAHLRVLRGETQIIPDTGTIEGDGESLSFDEYIEIPTEETWRIEVWNEDEVYRHCFYVRFEVVPKFIANPVAVLAQMFKRFLEVMGIE